MLPEEYDLTLEPDLEQFTFDGIVKITCDVQVATDTVSVHAMDLVLSQAVFRSSGSSSAIKADSITTKAPLLALVDGGAKQPAFSLCGHLQRCFPNLEWEWTVADWCSA